MREYTVSDPCKITETAWFRKLSDAERATVLGQAEEQIIESTETRAMLCWFYGLKPWEVENLTSVERLGFLLHIPRLVMAERTLRRQADTSTGTAHMLDLMGVDAGVHTNEELVSYNEQASKALKQFGRR